MIVHARDGFKVQFSLADLDPVSPVTNAARDQLRLAIHGNPAELDVRLRQQAPTLIHRAAERVLDRGSGSIEIQPDDSLGLDLVGCGCDITTVLFRQSKGATPFEQVGR